MALYLARRLLQSLLLLILASSLIFVIINSLPGKPYEMMRREMLSRAPSNAKNLPTQSHWDRLDALFGLDRPLPQRYVEWLRSTFTGDFGLSWSVASGQKVLGLVLQFIPYTLVLMVAATLLSVVVAIPLGVTMGLNPQSYRDLFITLGSYFGLAMPPYWIGLLLIGVFSSALGWLPFGGVSDPDLPGDLVMLIGRGFSFGAKYPEMAGAEGRVLGDGLLHLLLPAVTVSILLIVRWTRFVRSSLIETMGQDFIRTARAKGLPERMVVLRHALRNSLIPVVTIIALDIPRLFTGAFITEIVFTWPGIGRLYINGMLRGDWPVLVGVLVAATYLIVFSNLIADLVYSVVDPRVKSALLGTVPGI